MRQYPSLCPSSSRTAPSRAAISEPARRPSLPSRSAVSITPHKFPSWRSHPQSSEVYCCPKWKSLLPKVEVTAAQSGSYCCPKWKSLLPKVEVTAAQSGSSVPLRGMKAPTILIECKKKVFRRLSAAKLESANLNTLHKWKGTFAARALIAEPIKEP